MSLSVGYVIVCHVVVVYTTKNLMQYIQARRLEYKERVRRRVSVCARGEENPIGGG